MSAKPPLRYLRDVELAALGIEPPEVADALEGLVRGCARGEVSVTPKALLHPGGDRLFMATLAHSDSPPYAVTKTVGLDPGNPGRGLPYIGSVINLLDGATGMPLAVMDGAWITAVRTAALSAVAARRLARPDSASVLFVGCGVQARSHLDALAAEFPIERVFAASRTAVSAGAFADLARGRGLDAELVDDPAAALARADIVVSSVSLAKDMAPFLDAAHLAPGAFAALVDIGRPWHIDALESLDRVVVDDLEQERAVGPALDLERVHGDLHTLVLGTTAARAHPRERCALVSRGFGLGDLALAYLAYERARDAGVGQVLA